MGSVAFDTLKAAKRLGEAGFEPEQAEALVGIFAGELNDTLATKEDLEQQRRDLTAQIKQVSTELGGEIKALDQKIDTVQETLDARIVAVDQKIDTVKETLEAKIESASRKTIIWLGGTIIAAATILGVLDRIFPPPV